MRRTLSILGAGILFLWTGLGLVAWSNVARRMAADSEPPRAESQEAMRFSALADEVGTLHQDLRALAVAMGENLQALNDAVLTSQEEHAAAMTLQVAALRDEVGSLDDSPSADELSDLLRGLEALRDVQASPTQVPETQLVHLTAAAPSRVADEETSALEGTPPVEEPRVEAEAEASPAPKKKSFLAFKLPSDDFRFDERRTWTVLPTLSRVGFDAVTTLHDFTATTSSRVARGHALLRPGR